MLQTLEKEAENPSVSFPNVIPPDVLELHADQKF